MAWASETLILRSAGPRREQRQLGHVSGQGPISPGPTTVRIPRRQRILTRTIRTAISRHRHYSTNTDLGI